MAAGLLVGENETSQSVGDKHEAIAQASGFSAVFVRDIIMTDTLRATPVHLQASASVF